MIFPINVGDYFRFMADSKAMVRLAELLDSNGKLDKAAMFKAGLLANEPDVVNNEGAGAAPGRGPIG